MDASKESKVGIGSLFIEKASPEDYADIAKLNVEAYREYAAQMTDESWRTMARNISATDLITEHSTFIVARVEGRLAGSVAYGRPGRGIAPIPKEWASIRVLAVAPEHRGQGIARALMDECLRLAAADHAPTVGLFTSEVMAAARRRYESMGFVIDHEIERRNGLRYWLYRLDLAPTALSS